MARLPRLCVPGWPHVVVQTARSGQRAFFDDADRERYLEVLGQSTRANGVAVHAYGLADGEVRLLVTPDAADALGRTMQALGRHYGMAFNRRHGHTGTLWEGRFRATVVEPEQHLLDAMLYVEEAPGSGEEPSPWSSAGHHVGQRHDARVGAHPGFWSLGNTPFEREAAYRVLRHDGLDAATRRRVDDAVRRGWPLGSSDFLAAVGQQTARRVVPLPRGRPPRQR